MLSVSSVSCCYPVHAKEDCIMHASVCVHVYTIVPHINLLKKGEESRLLEETWHSQSLNRSQADLELDFSLDSAVDHCGGWLAQQDNIASDRAAWHSHRAHLEPQRAAVAIPPQLSGQQTPLFRRLQSVSFKNKNNQLSICACTFTFVPSMSASHSCDRQCTLRLECENAGA